MKIFLTWTCLAIILFAGVFAAVRMTALPRTYEGDKAPVSVYELREDPDSGREEEANSAADAIIQQNLKNARAVNDVTSIVFDFRGYDTMGEAFILITAVAGTMVILFTKKEKKEDEQK